MNIKRKIEAWRRAGLLDDERATAIALYEEEHASSSRWVLWGITAVGGLAIVTGIISVVAANWDDIPDWLKLSGCGALLLGSLAGAWGTARLASSWPRDLFLFFHDGMLLAAIGLIAQVYNLHGHPWRALALCAALALPATTVAVHGLLADVFLAYVTLALGFFFDEAGWFNHFERDFGVGFLGASLGLVFLLAVDFVQPRKAAAAAALRRWGFGLIGITAIGACLLWNEHMRWVWQQAYWPMAFFVVVALPHAIRELIVHRPGSGIRLASLVLLIALLVGAALTYSSGTDHVGRQLIGFTLFCALCTSVAIAAANAGSKVGTNFATLALAGRVLVLYFELAKNLMTTGVSLIATGGVCLAVAYGWWRLRRVLPIAPRLNGAA